MRRILLIGSLFVAGCGGERLTEGADEPLRVQGAQFFKGDLPGSRPLNLEEVKAGKEPKKPFSTTPEIAGRLLSASEASVGLSGTASQDSYAVALKLDKLGTGYWVLPVGSPDPFNNNDLSWSARVDLADVPAGLHQLRVAALDEANRAGTQRSLELCIRSPVPDNLNACDPTIEPPRLVASLAWDSSADLDLSVLTPSGEVINYAHVNDAKKTDTPGQFSGDAGTGCIPSGSRHESVVWQAKPAKGIYYIYVNLSDPCEDGATPFEVTTHVSKRRGEEFELVESYRTASELLSVQANGGATLGTFITEFVVE
jgi:hypothetical protein